MSIYDGGLPTYLGDSLCTNQRWDGGISLEEFTKIVRKYGFTTRIVPDMGSLEVRWDELQPIMNSNLRDRVNTVVLECYVMDHTVSRIFFHRPEIISISAFKKYVMQTLSSENNNEPVATYKWDNTVDVEVENLEELEMYFKEALFLVKWSINFQNSDLLDKARTELRSLPKADEPAMMEAKFKKIERSFHILLDDTRFTLLDK